jgi:predicted AAA+ superfamily ATPase
MKMDKSCKLEVRVKKRASDGCERAQNVNCRQIAKGRPTRKGHTYKNTQGTILGKAMKRRNQREMNENRDISTFDGTNEPTIERIRGSFEAQTEQG